MVRAFAVLGMALVNFSIHTWGGYQLRTPADHWAQGAMLFFDLDHTVSLVFSFLIGFGFASSRVSVRAAVRRLVAFFVIGVVNLLVSGGDVLCLYATIGLLLLPFRKSSDRNLLIIAALLVPLPRIVYGLGSHVFPGIATGTAEALHTSDVIRSAGFLSLVRIYLADMAFRYAHARNYLWATDLASLWLLGTVAGRRGLLKRTGENRRLWSHSLRWLLPLAVVGEAWHPLLDWMATVPRMAPLEHLLHRWSVVVVMTMYGAPALALVYVAAILLAVENLPSRPLAPLVAAGRMALTNYLLQSVGALFLFTGVGLGWSGRLGFAAGCALAVAFFVAEALFSMVWLRRLAFGPAEWILRIATYGGAVRIRTPASR